MAKKIIVAVMLGAAFIGAFFAVRTFFKTNETAVYNRNHTWHTESGSGEGRDLLVRGRHVDDIKNDVQKLIIALNRAVEEEEVLRPRGDGVAVEFPRISLQKIEGGTAFVEVLNDRYLTQTMGSSGAQDYLAEATYTLTEHPGITAVSYIFAPGDHAMPGVYSRESFTAYAVVRDDGSRNR